MDLGYLPIVDPVVERGPGAGLGQSISSYLQTRSATLLGAGLRLMAAQAIPGTKQPAEGASYWEIPTPPRPMPCNSSSQRKHFFGNSCIICALGGPGLQRNDCIRLAHVPQRQGGPGA